MFEKGKKNTKYFLTLEKSGFDRKQIFDIKNEQGNIMTHQTRILGVLKFHQNITSSNHM